VCRGALHRSLQRLFGLSRVGCVSAICGVIGVDARAWSEGDLDGVVDSLSRIGPDGCGRWAGTAGRCGVAVAAALRHSTPEDAADRQPAQNGDGSLLVVADLRLDNRHELATVLGLADAVTVPDSAFVLAAYERWGEAMLDRIVGEFALALIDRRRGGVLLARDHAGTRPLVVHERPGAVAFASNALALTGLAGVGHALDVRRAVEVLGLVFDSERTFVEGVSWVPPAAALWIDDSGVRRRTWWKADPNEIVELSSPAAHEQELREAFDLAVAARLRSVGAVGAMTSGGLDSASATATAARLLAPGRLRTYTSAPPQGWSGGERSGWDADETPLVRALAEQHPNIDPSFVHVEPGGRLFDMYEPLWERGAGPGRNPANWLWFQAIADRAAAQGVTTLLTGARGNVVFSADGPEWLAVLVRAGRLRQATREARAWSRGSGESRARTLLQRAVFPLLPPRVQRLGRAAWGRAPALDTFVASTALRPEIVAELDLTARRPVLDERHRRNVRAAALQVLMAGSGQADIGAALAALTGVEERDPAVDRRVVEVAMHQPEWVRRHDGITRAVARRAMADRLPPEIVNRTRRGEQLPDWLDVMTAARAELAQELDELRGHSTSQELIDVPRLEALMNRWPDRSARLDPNVLQSYRLALLRSLLVSRYLRWFERRAAGRDLGSRLCR
jgi:asparagine synthase (glutamine-hydrolysing)